MRSVDRPTDTHPDPIRASHDELATGIEDKLHARLPPPTKRFGRVEMTELNEPNTRTYVYAPTDGFPDGVRLRFHDVTHISVKKSDRGDSHRLRTKAGDFVYVAPGWLAIELGELEKGWSL